MACELESRVTAICDPLESFHPAWSYPPGLGSFDLADPMTVSRKGIEMSGHRVLMTGDSLGKPLREVESAQARDHFSIEIQSSSLFAILTPRHMADRSGINDGPPRQPPTEALARQLELGRRTSGCSRARRLYKFILVIITWTQRTPLPPTLDEIVQRRFQKRCTARSHLYYVHKPANCLILCTTFTKV